MAIVTPAKEEDYSGDDVLKDMMASMKQLQGEQDDDIEEEEIAEEAPPVKEEKVEVDAADTGETEIEKEMNRDKSKPRAKDGKFVKAAATQTTAVTPPATKATTVVTDQIDPPTFMTAEGKEWFNKQPVEYKKETKRRQDEMDRFVRSEVAKQTQLSKDLEDKTREVGSAVEVVRRHLPIWGSTGRTPEMALSELCAFETLVRRDPEAALNKLAEATGKKITIEGAASETVKNNTSTQNNDYQSVYERVKKDLTADNQKTHIDNTATQIQAEWEKVKGSAYHEKSETGNYIYPDFHDEDFQRKFEPLAIEIAKSNPSLSFDEVFIRTYQASGGRIIPKQIPATAKLNGNNQVTGARRAASSRPNSYGSSFDDEIEDIPGETTEETAMRIAKRYGFV